MFLNLFRKKKEVRFERTYDAPIDRVWNAWTDPTLVKQWWGAKDTIVSECEIDLRVGGRIYIVVEAGDAMGKYKGTRWPMEGTFTVIEAPSKLTYNAQAWTEGEKDTSTIDQINELTLTGENGKTTLNLRVTIIKTGLGAQMAAFGMRWGYKQQLDKLGEFLAA
ncbi:MAG: SRPBCC domain-containing protein [Ardenticatenaceae bacterium]|nr:SRPBCC domain-containing protein [Ardenticatenaceae bacterium]